MSFILRMAERILGMGDVVFICGKGPKSSLIEEEARKIQKKISQGTSWFSTIF